MYDQTIAIPASFSEFSETSVSEAGYTTEQREMAVSKRRLVDRLNYLNFQNNSVILNYRHARYDRGVSLKAVPQPCVGDYLVCLWRDKEGLGKILKNYVLESLLVPNGQKLISVTPEIRCFNEKGICLKLPGTSHEAGIRRTRRYECKTLCVQLIQHSVFFQGVLIDFSGNTFRVSLKAIPPQTFQWINPKSRVHIVLSDGDQVYYSGECRILKQTDGPNTREFLLETLNRLVQRFKPKEFRSERLVLTPLPDMVFEHPFINRLVNLKVIDVSGSGFSVEEDERDAILLPGMVVPCIELSIAGGFGLKCMAQVVYRKVQTRSNDERYIKCGLTFLDMSLEDHQKLLSLLHQADNRNAYVSNKVDLDALWDFFFETGFIYPRKYTFLNANKEKIKKTYKKLYTESPRIARHFIYQEKGLIQGHMSMLRFYENTWLIHHHAARRRSFSRSGLIVLDQIGRFTYDSHRLFSSHMDFLMCYYRPDNMFPNRVFGGVAEKINNKQACSVDTFGYFHCRKSIEEKVQMPYAWSLTQPDAEDFSELEGYYAGASGGLMLQALDLLPDSIQLSSLADEYRQQGFNRDRHIFALKINDRLKAVIMANITDTALNLSDLTNSIKFIILDQDGVSKDILNAALLRVSKYYHQKKIPVLIYPSEFAEKISIPLEKLYTLWILRTQHSDDYFKVIDLLTKETG